MPDTLLRYAVTTDQFPLQASAATGDLTRVQLTVQGTNPNQNADKDPVVLQGVAITFTVGNDGADLTADVPDIGPVPPPGWGTPDVTTNDGSVTFTFFPSGDGDDVGGEGLSFVFNDVQINRNAGTVTISIVEGSDNCESDCPSADLQLTKFPAGWGQVSFWVAPSVVETVGAPVTLHWAGPPVATYTIDYYDWGKGQPVHLANLANQGASQEIPLYQSTTFTLSVDANVGGTPYHSESQQTATVPDKTIAILSFKALPDYVPPGFPVSLQWKTRWANTWTLKPGDTPVPLPSPSPGGYQIEPGYPIAMPASRAPSTVTYHLQADDADGNQLSAPVEIDIDPAIVTSAVSADYPGAQGDTGQGGDPGAENGWFTNGGPGTGGGDGFQGSPGPRLTIVIASFDRWLLKVSVTSADTPSQTRTWLVAASGKLTVTSTGGKGGTGGSGGPGGLGGEAQESGESVFRPCGGSGGPGGRGGPGNVGGDIVVNCPSSLKEQALASIEAISVPGPGGDPGPGGSPGISLNNPCSGGAAPPPSWGPQGRPGDPGTAGQVTWNFQDRKESPGRFARLRMTGSSLVRENSRKK